MQGEETVRFSRGAWVRPGRPRRWPLAAGVLLAVLASVAGDRAAGQQPAPDPLAAVPRVSLGEFKQLLDAGSILVIDTRDTSSYVSGHIPGAISVPLDRVTEEAATLKAARKPIVAYCS
jgi:hypothetical protein